MSFATNSSAFGIKPAGTTPAPTTGTSIFGQSAKPAGTSIFGNPTQATNSIFGGGGGGSTFGQQNQQQQQPAAGGSIFGSQPAASGGTNIFGQPTQQQQQQQGQPAAGTSLFGQSTQQPAAGGTSLFGQSQPATGGTSIFGQSTQQPAATGTGLFGQSTQQPAATGSSIFGQSTQQPAATGTSLFGQPGQQQQQQQQPAAGTSLFGQPSQQQQGTSLFGQQQQQPAAGTSIFGQPAQQQQQQQPSLFGGGGSSIFGSNTGNNNAGSSIFGQAGQPTGAGAFGGGASMFGQRPAQQPFGQSAVQQPAGPPPFTKTTKFNDLPDEIKKTLEQIDAHIQGRIQISKDLQQRKLGEEATKGQELVRAVHKDLTQTSTTIRNDLHFTRDLKAKADQAVQDTIISTRIVDGFRNPQVNGAYLKDHASFPLEFFTRVTQQIRERLVWYKATIEQVERKLSSMTNQTHVTPQGITSTLQAQHTTFLALASKTAALDAELQKIKTLYTQLWRARTGSVRDPFDGIGVDGVDVGQGGRADLGMSGLSMR